MLDGLIVSFEVSLLESVTVTPPGRAGLVKNTGSAAHSPGANLTPAANEIFEFGLTVTPPVALGTLGSPAVAVIVANPAPTALTGTLTVVALAWKATDAGTAATPGLLEPNATAVKSSVRRRLAITGWPMHTRMPTRRWLRSRS